MPICLAQISDEQLVRYAELIYATAGIRISPQKRMMLSNRVRRRLRANGIDDFEAYFQQLAHLPANHPEWDAFLQEVSTHETFLFRDEGHWNWFQHEFLLRIMEAARAGKRPRRLRIWSAACSTGDEAYTAAACIADTIRDHYRWQIEIVGTDIGVGAIQQAAHGRFNERAMRLVSTELRSRYFQKIHGADDWQARPELSQWTHFQQHNLLKPLPLEPFDLIFVKNVLIYFDLPAKRRALENILPLLVDGGALVTAAAEGVSGLLDGMEKLTPWLYRKPATTTC